MTLDTLWDIPSLLIPPASRSSQDFIEPGLDAVFYESLAWRGRPTESFAWIGFPEGASPHSPVPAMVLVHGGGGTAFADWVRLWTERGYAAIAMDTCGSLPLGEHPDRPRHERGGPPGWHTCVEKAFDPPVDQWPYHAVADVLLAHSLLANDPRVDADRVGLHGVSWGGYLACMAAGLDPRLKLVISAYGAGFFGRHGSFAQRDKLPDHFARWHSLWDAAKVLPRAAMPMLWLSAPNDFAFPLLSQWESADITLGDTTLGIRVEMEHGQHQGAEPVEAELFADHVLRGGPPLPRVVEDPRDGRDLSATIKSSSPIARVGLAVTDSDAVWAEREWRNEAAQWDAEAGRVSGHVPEAVTAAFLFAEDNRGALVSARPWWDPERAPKPRLAFE